MTKVHTVVMTSNPNDDNSNNNDNKNDNDDKSYDNNQMIKVRVDRLLTY